MTAGGELRLHTWQSNGRICLEVSDTGQGIAPSNLENIFNPFFTTKPNGTGLGLAVSQKIVRDHRGEIQVESEVGQGTTFTITLPVRNE
jgi:signal transduction histidine kinase